MSAQNNTFRGSSIITIEKTRPPFKRWFIAVIFIFGASVCGLFLLFGLKSTSASGIINKISSRITMETMRVPKNNSSRKDSAFLTTLEEVLKKMGANNGDSVLFNHRKNTAADSIIQLAARIPKGLQAEVVAWNISQATAETSYSLADCVIDERKQRYVFYFASLEKKAPRIQLIVSRSEHFQAGTSKMAIIGEVVDDSAFQTVVSYLSIPEPLGIAPIAGKKQSTLIAQLAVHYHKEVIIRLPLEPLTKMPSNFMAPVVMVHYPRETIRSIMSQAVVSVPHFSGFTNLWGSRALEDSRIMNIVLSEIKNQGGYFIEAKTAKKSVAPEIADTLGVPYEMITGAIAEKTNQSEIDRQIKSFCLIAQRNGSAIITVPITLPVIAAIKADLAWFRQNGILLMPAAEIVKKNTEP
jgi:polysaccharide deacetylase 2 family uncharacterized protein YibQ